MHGLFTANYEAGLARYGGNTPFAERAALSVGIGVAAGEGLGMIALEIGPTYVIPIDAYWSLPIGVALGHAVGTRSTGVRGPFVGLSIGIKRFYGNRRYLR